MLNFLGGLLGVRKALERTCAKCGSKQQVPPDKLEYTVACAKCGAPMPPKS